MRSLKKTIGKAMAGVGIASGVAAAPSGVAAWEDFSDFSNAVPISGAKTISSRAMGSGDTSGFASDDEPHPLTKDWATRIKNPKVRAAFVKQSIETYTRTHDLGVWCGTWNTNGKAPPQTLDISQWLDVSSKPDVVVVGFQEIVPLTPGKVLMQEDTVATGEWEAIIERCLNGRAGGATHRPNASSAPTTAWATFGNDAAPGGASSVEPSTHETNEHTHKPTYVRVACKQLVGVYITVWVTGEVKAQTRDVRAAHVATGVNLGVTMLGNKGGVGVMLTIYNTPMCFVCAHLSAGAKENDAQKRSEDYHEINGKLTFPAPPAASSDGTFEKPAFVGDAFAAVFLGDLNYRLNIGDDVVRQALAGDAPTPEESQKNSQIGSTASELRNKKYASLLGSDQLLLERAAGRAFSGWREAPVSFPPTYKYRPGTHTYSGVLDVDDEADKNDPDKTVKVSAKEEKKKRTPAWCDRVLWKGVDIVQISYGRSELTQSDHKPVFSRFTVTARELLPTELQGVLQETRRELDAAEMASQPRCTVTNPRATFCEPLRFAQPTQTSWRLINTGDVPASWNFVAAVPGETAVAPPWLTVRPTQGKLLPGEETVITATATVVGGGGAGPAALFAAAGAGGYEYDGANTSSANSSRTSVGSSVETQNTKPVPVAGSIAEAARMAQARAVSAGIAKVEAGGGVSINSPDSRSSLAAAKALEHRGGVNLIDQRPGSTDLIDQRPGSTPQGSPFSSTLNLTGLVTENSPEIPVDAILVLHLQKGRDFFLTVSGGLRRTVFGEPLWRVPTASFPPNVPQPVAQLVDYLFSTQCGVEVFNVPSLGTLGGLASVAAALDSNADVDTVPGMNPHHAAFALLALFASLPRPLCAATPQLLAGIDTQMQPWANAAAQQALAAAATGAPWTLATEVLTSHLPSVTVGETLLSKHLRHSERAAYAHTVSWVRQVLRSGGGVQGGGGIQEGVAAKVVSQLAEVWFPKPAPGATNAAAVRMGRLAFVCVLCGVAPNALDGFNPMETLYDVTLGVGLGGGPAGTLPVGTAGTVPSGTPAGTGVGLAGMMGIGIGGGGLGTGNLIDF